MLLEARIYAKFEGFGALEIVHNVRIYAERKLRGRVPDKLLTNGHVYAAFRATRYKGVPQVVQLMTGAEFLKRLTDVAGGIIKDTFGAFALVAGAAFPFRLLALSVQNGFYIVRQKDMAIAVGGLGAFDENKAFRFVYVLPFEGKRFRAANARIDVKEHEPLSAGAFQPLEKGFLFGDCKGFSAFFCISDMFAQVEGILHRNAVSAGFDKSVMPYLPRIDIGTAYGDLRKRPVDVEHGNLRNAHIFEPCGRM